MIYVSQFVETYRGMEWELTDPSDGTSVWCVYPGVMNTIKTLEKSGERVYGVVGKHLYVISRVELETALRNEVRMCAKGDARAVKLMVMFRDRVVSLHKSSEYTAKLFELAVRLALADTGLIIERDIREVEAHAAVEYLHCYFSGMDKSDVRYGFYLYNYRRPEAGSFGWPLNANMVMVSRVYGSGIWSHKNIHSLHRRLYVDKELITHRNIFEYGKYVDLLTAEYVDKCEFDKEFYPILVDMLEFVKKCIPELLNRIKAS